jgi:hypothetical protein
MVEVFAGMQTHRHKKIGAASVSITAVSRTTLSIHAFWITMSSTPALRKMAYSKILVQLSQNQNDNNPHSFSFIKSIKFLIVMLSVIMLNAIVLRVTTPKILGNIFKTKTFYPPKNIFKLRNNIHKKF